MVEKASLPHLNKSAPDEGELYPTPRLKSLYCMLHSVVPSTERRPAGPLHRAVRSENAEHVRVLLDWGVEDKWKDRDFPKLTAAEEAKERWHLFPTDESARKVCLLLNPGINLDACRDSPAGAGEDTTSGFRSITKNSFAWRCMNENVNADEDEECDFKSPRSSLLSDDCSISSGASTVETNPGVSSEEKEQEDVAELLSSGDKKIFARLSG
ncbi:unnamed protein product [Amoebophrya sp. A120]|nr:unnamed protein product [Amoebophrya sp. A120]|eukprot:GSA120T00000564001.1